ncbi:6909_t:CDS:2 [Dentiscutata erythropus]|uniref:6909_t:CDS:1 n=1 Tax=Dentiscutata erythropus TaxID=1348616 RepID=A0A9N9F8Z1_9GLOM|nr:6909_t:CDS:2 [Dentiscutata erythropus]
MSISETNTPASTSTSFTAAEEKNVPTLAEMVRNYKTKELIEFLRKEEDLGLDEDDLEIIRKQKIMGRDFLKITEEKLGNWGMLGGPATRIVDFIKELSKRKLKAFSSYKSLKEVLKKYDIDGNGIGTIRQFSPKTYTLKDEDDELQQCIREIKRRLGNMGTVLADSNEAMRCEYISTILHASLYIVKGITNKELTLAPQLEIVGEESTSRVDYAIKALEELICITEGKLHQVVMGFAQNLIQCESALQTNKRKRKRKSNEEFMDDYDYIYGIVTTATDWYFILYTSDGISCTSKNPLNIRFTESVLREGSEEEKDVCKNVKRVMEVIVGLLKDRMDVEREPAAKKQRVQEFFENQE